MAQLLTNRIVFSKGGVAQRFYQDFRLSVFFYLLTNVC
jgi:hypothetical protein